MAGSRGTLRLRRSFMKLNEQSQPKILMELRNAMKGA
jgi:hypothetical protein